MMKKVLILGAGYGGLLSALTLRKYMTAEEAAITVVNRYPTHQIMTELHRLAADTISEQAIALPLHRLLQGKQVDICVDTVLSIQPDNNQVELESGTTYVYDVLVIALGSETAFYGIPGLRENSYTLKSIEDANRIRNHIKGRIEAYRNTKDTADMTIIVGGGGLTGVELVGELADMLPKWCSSMGVNPQDVRLYNIESSPTILQGFEAGLVTRAQTSLKKRGVHFINGAPVIEVQGNKVLLKDGQSMQANTLVWTGGVQGSEIVANCGIKVERGRAIVNSYLQSTSNAAIFVVGDSAIIDDEKGRPYPPSAQLAWQMGETVGYNMFAYLNNDSMQMFKPTISGKIASLGRKDAIASVGASGIPFTGLPASLIKEASKMRYLAHIRALFAYVH
ncbi:NAD(P)/FAD-dependent oxidoreductase [Paenibacillus arenosi]|uniref:NAD(P)/FAD-dependent oxidoreductase n=1 Tax=Paenibacillus arenosi TaxID=2774142 RepID=A0ABR9AWD5_9BACL|nr:NAD(P)/FAD-dependent oxidoreductase [Paenibacillus arenosi]MBD8498444.1 NAD(P)/FAD-dependent oxidoreductase [Paenibacillus arenosi]